MIIKVTQTCIALWFIFFVPPVSHESMRMALFLFGPKCRVWCLFGGAQSIKHKPPVKTQDLCKFPSPTLGKQSKMLLLQLIASMGWSLGSFDIKAAFLQGKPQKDKVIGLDPVVELARAMNLKTHEICKLDKSAYDAPYLWFQTLQEELKSLGFKPSPFDPCVFVLRHPNSHELSGVLGIHVDDGIYGGDQFFQDQISKLEEKYPFSSKKSQSFTFTLLIFTKIQTIALNFHNPNTSEISIQLC